MSDVLYLKKPHFRMKIRRDMRTDKIENATFYKNQKRKIFKNMQNENFGRGGV